MAFYYNMFFHHMVFVYQNLKNGHSESKKIFLLKQIILGIKNMENLNRKV
jgi:hypothetical protein